LTLQNLLWFDDKINSDIDFFYTLENHEVRGFPPEEKTCMEGLFERSRYFFPQRLILDSFNMKNLRNILKSV